MPTNSLFNALQKSLRPIMPSATCVDGVERVWDLHHWFPSRNAPGLRRMGVFLHVGVRVPAVEAIYWPTEKIAPGHPLYAPMKGITLSRDQRSRDHFLSHADDASDVASALLKDLAEHEAWFEQTSTLRDIQTRMRAELSVEPARAQAERHWLRLPIVTHLLGEDFEPLLASALATGSPWVVKAIEQVAPALRALKSGAPPPELGPHIGARITHAKFGEGVITKVDAETFDITFDSGEKKSLLARFVRLI